MEIINCKLKIALLLVLFLSIGGISSPVYADAIDLSLYPPLTEIVATTGAQIKAPLTLTNHTQRNRNITLMLQPFRPQGQGGKIAFTASKDLPKGILSLEKNGKTILPGTGDFVLRAGETSQLTLGLDIPQQPSGGFEPGQPAIATAQALQAGRDYYVTLLFGTKNEAGSLPGEVASEPKSTLARSIVDAAVGTHVLLAIHGGGDEASQTPIASLAGLAIKNSLSMGQNRSLLIEGEPLAFSLSVGNGGLHFFKAGGSISLKDRSGSDLATVELPEQIILAGASRDLTAPTAAFGKKPLQTGGFFGTYSIVAQVSIREGEQEPKNLVQTLTLYILPKGTLMLSALTLLLAAYILGRLYRYVAKKNYEG